MKFILITVLLILFITSAIYCIYLHYKIKRLVENSSIDELTGFYNKGTVYKILSSETARAKREKNKFGLFFMDLDGFKHINDKMGHHVGDEMLSAIASNIKKCMREYDIMCRFGGDEFIIITPDINPQDIHVISSKIIDSVNMAAVISTEQKTGISIGAAVWPDDDPDPEELLRKADRAMYTAKSAGKNRYCVWSERIKVIESIPEKTKAKKSMIEALDNNEITLWYQTQRDTQTLQITGIEGLIRWNHPELGIIYPNDFIPLVDHMGLSDAYASQIIKIAVNHAKILEEKMNGRNPKLWINLSPAQLLSKRQNICSVLVEECKKFDLKHKNIGIELTEEKFMGDSDLFSDKLLGLKKQGFTIAIDDFGVGRFSLMDLKVLILDRIKIDKSLIKNVDVDERQGAITLAIVKMAKTIGYLVTAEGVENDTEFDYVRKIGVDDVQGFLFNRPVPFEELKEILL